MSFADDAAGLAVASDHCARCGRLLNINEPMHYVYAPSGPDRIGSELICQACVDATADAAALANIRAHAIDLEHMKLSDLLRYAGAFAMSAAPPEVRHRAAALNAELRKRADALRSVAPARGVIAVSSPAAVLRQIGEVR